MAQDKVQLPSGMGGLVRYFEDYKSKIVFKPHYVMFAILIFIIIEVFLHLF